MSDTTGIRITKRDIYGERLDWGVLLIGPTWVSNGHWMIRRSLISNMKAVEKMAVRGFCDGPNQTKRLSDRVARSVVADCGSRPWVLQEVGNVKTWLLESTLRCAKLHRRTATGEGCTIDGRYWDLIEPLTKREGVTLRGKGSDVGVAVVDRRGVVLAVVMPVRTQWSMACVRRASGRRRAA